MTGRMRAAAVLVAVVGALVAAFVVAVRPDRTEPVGIEEALAGFVRVRFGAPYVGECPDELGPGDEIPRGICSLAFERAESSAVYRVGPPFSEWLGEVHLARDQSGSWSVTDYRPLPYP